MHLARRVRVCARALPAQCSAVQCRGAAGIIATCAPIHMHTHSHAHTRTHLRRQLG